MLLGLGSSRYKFYSLFPTQVSNLLKTLVNEDRDFRSSGPLDERKNDLEKKHTQRLLSLKINITKINGSHCHTYVRLSGQNPDPNPRPPSPGIFLHTLSTFSHSYFSLVSLFRVTKHTLSPVLSLSLEKLKLWWLVFFLYRYHLLPPLSHLSANKSLCRWWDRYHSHWWCSLPDSFFCSSFLIIAFPIEKVQFFLHSLLLECGSSSMQCSPGWYFICWFINLFLIFGIWVRLFACSACSDWIDCLAFREEASVFQWLVNESWTTSHGFGGRNQQKSPMLEQQQQQKTKSTSWAKEMKMR